MGKGGGGERVGGREVCVDVVGEFGGSLLDRVVNKCRRCILLFGPDCISVFVEELC